MPTMLVEIAVRRCPPARRGLRAPGCASISAAPAPPGLARPYRSCRLRLAARPAGLANPAAGKSVRARRPLKRGGAQPMSHRAAKSHGEAALIARGRYDRATAIPKARPPAVSGIAPQTAERARGQALAYWFRSAERLGS